MKDIVPTLLKLAFDPVFRSRYVVRHRAELALGLGRNSVRYRQRRLRIRNPHDFGLLHEEIFLRRIYDFETDNSHPVLIDGGANIGLASIRWSSLFPGAKILAFEPDPENFALLQENLANYGCSGASAIQAAISSRSGPARLIQDDRLSSHLGGGGSGAGVEVACVRLKDLLNEPVEFLKLDIEGAELDALADCEEELRRVRLLFVEYHSYAGQPQKLDELLGLLRRAGFRCWLHGIDVPAHPFERRPVADGELDMCINVFGTRP